jgi:hypothetical protein
MKRLITIIVLSLGFLVFTGVAHAVEREAGGAANFPIEKNQPDGRVETLKRVLQYYDSPLEPYAAQFVLEADRYMLDWRLVAAISGVESTFGKHIPPGSYNAWGWGIPTGAQSGIAFSDWKKGISTVSSGLRKNYYNRGAQTIDDVGRIYAASKAWPTSVRFFLAKIDTFSRPDSKTLKVTL